MEALHWLIKYESANSVQGMRFDGDRHRSARWNESERIYIGERWNLSEMERMVFTMLLIVVGNRRSLP